MPQILQASLQQYLNQELPDVQEMTEEPEIKLSTSVGFRNDRGTRNQIVNIRWIIKKAREFQKNICFIEYAKGFDYVDHSKL